MLGFSPLASAPLGGGRDRARVGLIGRLASGFDLSGSTKAVARVQSEGPPVLDLVARSGGSSANSAAINGTSIVIGFGSAKTGLKCLAATTGTISGDSAASAQLAAKSVSSWDNSGLGRAGASVRARSSDEFVVARALTTNVDATGDVSASVALLLTAAAVSTGETGASGELALAGGSVVSAGITPVLTGAVAFDGRVKASAPLTATLEDPFAIVGIIAAQNTSLAVSAGGIAAVVSSSGAPSMGASAGGNIHLARSIRAVAEVAAQAEAPIKLGGSSTGSSICGASASGVVNLRTMGSAGGVSSNSASAGTFVALTQSEAGNLVDILSSRAIGLVGVSVGRSEASAGGASVGDLSGTADARTAIGASAQAVLALNGQTTTRLVAQAQSSEHLDILCALDAAAEVNSAVAPDIGLSGSGVARVAAHAAVDVVPRFGCEAQASVATHGIIKATAIVQDGAAAQTGLTSAANSALTLIGRSSASSLSPLFGQAIAGVPIDALARAGASASAIATPEAGFGATATGAAALRSSVLGTVDIAGPSEIGVTILGQSGRSMPIFGTTTSALGLGSEVTGALAVQGTATTAALRATTATDTVQLSGATGMRGAVSGAGEAMFDTALQADGVVPLPAVAGSRVALDAIAHVMAASAGTGLSALSLSGRSAAVVPTILRASGTVALTPDAAGAVVAAGAARGTLNALRVLVGDTDLTGDAVRQISFDGDASAGIALEVWALEGALDLPTATAADAPVSGSAQGELEFAGDAVLALRIGAGAKPELSIAMTTAALVGLNATATPAVLFGGAAGIRLATRGTAQSAHGIKIAGTCATAASGQTDSALALDLRGTVQPGVFGSGTGAMEFTRATLSTVRITAHTARSMPLSGLGSGHAANAGKATLARLSVGLATTAQTRTQAKGATASALYGLGAARAFATGAGLIDLGFARFGLGEVLVAGATLRGIALLGDASTHVDAAAAANANVTPGLESAASNIIAIAFTGQGQMPRAVLAANTITTCQFPAGLLEARGTGIGYRAPPALRRSELPNTRQGGHLAPSLRSGRIL